MKIVVRSRRLELPRVAPQRPQRCASTNSATTARNRASCNKSANGLQGSRTASSGGSGRLVHAAFGHIRQLLIRRLLLFERGRELGGAIVAAEFFSPGNEGAIARNLVVLDRLRRR